MTKPHKDPEIDQAWVDAREQLAAMLRPWVVEHKVEEIARDFVDGLDLRGWRPPLGKQPDVIAEAKARRIQEDR